jgi:hypothetical protein
MSIFSSRTDIIAMTYLKQMLNDVGLKGILLGTMKTLRKETIMNLAHHKYNSIRYHQVEIEIGTDAMMESFPLDNILLHHEVSAVAINQARRKPNRWVNSFQAIAPLTAHKKGSFFRGHISLKNWTYCPILRDSTTPFKGMCLFIYLK